MLILWLFLLTVVSEKLDLESLVLDKKMIDLVNNDPNVSWTAGENKVFVDKKWKDIQHMFRTHRALNTPRNLNTPKQKFGALPDFYDTYTTYPQCKTPIPNSGQCRSCWASSATRAMSDRFCAAGKKVLLSSQWLLSCESDEYGCQGAYLSREWEYMEKTGVCTDECFPYASSHGIIPKCPAKCKDGSELKMYKISNFTHYLTPEEAQVAIISLGSIQAGFEIYQDFPSYKKGVYRHTWGSSAGGWTAKIQGWGVDADSGLKYWNVAMDLSPDWGMDGYVWILRGVNEVEIEGQMYGGIPIL